MKNILAAIVICSLVTACGIPVIREYYKIESSEVQVKQNVIARCVQPGSHIEFDIGSNRKMYLTSGPSILYVSLYLKRGDQFRFTSSELIVTEGWPTTSLKPELFNWVHKATDFLPNDKFSFDFTIVLPPQNSVLPASKDVSEFKLRLPDALLNGRPIEFPSLNFKYTNKFYFEDICLR